MDTYMTSKNGLSIILDFRYNEAGTMSGALKDSENITVVRFLMDGLGSFCEATGNGPA